MSATPKAADSLADLLREAVAGEGESIQRLAGAIARTPRADHRLHLEAHLAQEREHAQRVAARLRRLGARNGAAPGPVALVQGIVAGGVGLVSGGIGLVTAPLALLRGAAGPREVLRNAEELAASEAREAMRYRAIERVAKRAGDEETERLAASIREEEEAQLDLLRREMPHLADHLVGGREPSRPRPRAQRRKPAQSRARGAGRRRPSAETAAPSRRARRHSETSGPDRAEAARVREAEREREEAEAREVSRDPGADPQGAGAELHVDEPWDGYDEMSAADVAARVAAENDAVRAAVRLYEGANRRREVVLRATSDG